MPAPDRGEPGNRAGQARHAAGPAAEPAHPVGQTPPAVQVLFGARNIFDKQPPVTESGYLGSLYVPYGRYWYMQIGKKF